MNVYIYIYIYGWVNYKDFTTTSLESLVNKGNHPLLWPQFRWVNYYNFPQDIGNSPPNWRTHIFWAVGSNPGNCCRWSWKKTWMTMSWKNSTSLDITCLQPVVIDFLKQNLPQFDPWEQNGSGVIINTGVQQRLWHVHIFLLTCFLPDSKAGSFDSTSCKSASRGCKRLRAYLQVRFMSHKYRNQRGPTMHTFF